VEQVAKLRKTLPSLFINHNKENKVNYKLYKELEITINELWNYLPDSVQKELNKVYDKYYEKYEEKTND